MDAICDLKAAGQIRLRYFAYGSNMDQNQMLSRVPSATLLSPARLDGFRVVFNKAAADGSAKANIHPSFAEDDAVLGCIYELSDSDFQLLKGFENGYVTMPVEVSQESAKVRAQTFIAVAPALIRGTASPEYIATILLAARALALPEDYVDSLRRSAV
jgi:hypothetical protein